MKFPFFITGPSYYLPVLALQRWRKTDIFLLVRENVSFFDLV